MPRIAPVDRPYRPEDARLFDLVMPEGVEPLLLFRTLARSPRVFPRFMRAGVLDRGPIPIRDRELVIHRTTANCRAEYEWGVHVEAYWRPLRMSEELLRATLHARWDDPVFSDRERALVRMCDELHAQSRLSDAGWEALTRHYDESQCLELIYTAGLYHVVSFFAGGLDLAPEPFAARFRDVGGESRGEPSD